MKNNSLSYRAATADDLELLTQTRVEFFAEIYKNLTDNEKAELYDCNKAYFEEALNDGTFAAFLAFDEDQLAATSGVTFSRIPPNLRNKTGKIAYISNMYTKPQYRGQGVAAWLFDMTVQEARRRGCGRVGLHATDMGRPIYEKYGFSVSENVLEYYLD